MDIEYLGKETLNLIKPRKEDSSKGDFGCLSTLCGCVNMTGAAVLSVLGALRSGVGLVRFAGNYDTVERIQRILFEPIFTSTDKIFDKRTTAFLCGCGIGRVYDRILPEILVNCNTPAILDADCINFLAKHIDILEKMNCEKVLTPHPAEMSRLLGCEVSQIQSNRQEIALEFAQKYNCILVLKGKNTVIADSKGRISVNTSGSNALSKGGSGDVLAGVIASLSAQGYDLYDAARLGVYLHGLAGDNLSEKYGKSGVLPSDLPCEIGRLLG